MRIVAKSEVFARTRILLGLTQRELARKAGLSHTYISLLERSIKSVGPGAAKRLSEALERPLEELFELSDE